MSFVVKTVYAMHLSGPEFEKEMDKMDRLIAELKSRIKETP